MRLALQLALADLRFQPVLALCSMLGIAAVLAPLLVVGGLRAGALDDLRRHLLEDPHAREIVSISNRNFSTDELAGIARWPEVSFLAPRTRTLAATILLWRSDGADQKLRLELVPSRVGDPLLSQAPAETNQLVLSKAAADRLGVLAGSSVRGGVSRIANGQRQEAVIDLRVSSIAPAAAYAREAAFVSLDLATLIEDYQDGIAAMPVSLAGWRSKPRKSFAGFRLYAARLDQVPALDAKLRGRDLDVGSRASDVANLVMVDRNITIIVIIVACLGGFGFLLSLGASLWADIDRKRSQLALLRLLGLTSAQVQAIPVIQASFLGFGGALAGVTGAEAAAGVINVYFSTGVIEQTRLCLLTWTLTCGSMLITISGAIVIANFAGIRARSVEPWEGINPR